MTDYAIESIRKAQREYPPSNQSIASKRALPSDLNVSDSVEAKRLELLERDDWQQLRQRIRPKYTFPTFDDKQLIGRRRKLTTAELKTYTARRKSPLRTVAHELAYPEYRAWYRKLSPNSGDVSIRLGSHIHGSQRTFTQRGSAGKAVVVQHGSSLHDAAHRPANKNLRLKGNAQESEREKTGSIDEDREMLDTVSSSRLVSDFRSAGAAQSDMSISPRQAITCRISYKGRVGESYHLPDLDTEIADRRMSMPHHLNSDAQLAIHMDAKGSPVHEVEADCATPDALFRSSPPPFPYSTNSDIAQRAEIEFKSTLSRSVEVNSSGCSEIGVNSCPDEDLDENAEAKEQLAREGAPSVQDVVSSSTLKTGNIKTQGNAVVAEPINSKSDTVKVGALSQGVTSTENEIWRKFILGGLDEVSVEAQCGDEEVELGSEGISKQQSLSMEITKTHLDEVEADQFLSSVIVEPARTLEDSAAMSSASSSDRGVTAYESSKWTYNHLNPSSMLVEPPQQPDASMNEPSISSSLLPQASRAEFDSDLATSHLPPLTLLDSTTHRRFSGSKVLFTKPASFVGRMVRATRGYTYSDRSGVPSVVIAFHVTALLTFASTQRRQHQHGRRRRDRGLS